MIVKNPSGDPPKPLTAAEIMVHPAFKHLEWDLPPTKKGMCEVAHARFGGPFNLYYEVHGEGPIKMVWVMGLGAYHTAWKRQTRYFAHQRKSKFTCLVLDNRGMGQSDKPNCRYTTTEMAQDVIELMRHLGWLDSIGPPKRDLNLIGVSMGGMIAQEMGLLIPEHLNSLILTSTAPRLVRTVPFVQNLRQRINMFIPRDIDVQIQETADRLIALDFLALPDTENDPGNGGSGEGNFPTNRDRFAAGELDKRLDKEGFTRKGFLLQAIAAGWHHKSPQQIHDLGDHVGRNRIAVLHGSADKMIDFHHAELLRDELGEGIEFKVWEDKAHVLVWEAELEYNQFIEGFVEKCASIKSE